MRLGCMKLFVMHLLSCDSFCAPVWHTPHPLSPSPSTQHSKTANILFVICSPLLHCTCRVFEAINEARDLFLMMAEWQTARLVLYGVFNFYFSQNPHLTTSSVRWVHMESCAKWRQDLPSTTHALVCRISSSCDWRLDFSRVSNPMGLTLVWHSYNLINLWTLRSGCGQVAHIIY